MDSHAKSLEEDRDFRKLRLFFVKNNQATFEKINEAINADDIKLAHRIVHTLKSNAGQIGENRLREIAGKAETLLLNETNQLDDGIKEILELELKATLDKLAPLMMEEEVKHIDILDDTTKVLEILDTLEPLLTKGKPECFNLIDDIRSIKGSETLTKLVEELEFKQALKELQKLKESF